MIDMAERAAIDGDFSSADELLRDVARIQEAELGPLHPDLANTLTNLGIVAEKTGRPGEAETFYRRAAAIAAASLSADHAMVAESRQNLEDFCRERGLPMAAAAVITTSAQDTVRVPDTFDPEVASRSQPLPSAPQRSPRRGMLVAIGAIVLVTVAVLVKRPWSSHEMPTPAPAQSAEASRPRPAVPAPIEPAQPPPVVSPASARPSGAISLVTAELCQTFSTSGVRWRCDPPGDSVARGPIVLYTRVKSSRDATVVHRWYREEILQQAVTLTIRANASEGYRTYSRQTMDGVGNWRVQVTTADGDLLHEQRFAVQ